LANPNNLHLLNTTDDLHAELEIENYKYYCRANNIGVDTTSHYTGVNILSCRGCAATLESSANSSRVSGTHDGNFPAINATIAYILPSSRTIHQQLANNQPDAAIQNMAALAPLAQNLKYVDPPTMGVGAGLNTSHQSPPSSPKFS